ncbi:MAG: GNAT family N-acetyltransferase [Ilumatobacteraceae bacterium]
MPPLDVVTLEGELVRLEPLTLDHTAEMVAAASTNRSTFGLTTVPEATVQSVERYITTAQEQYERGEGLAFATIRRSDDRLVGSTRFMLAEYWHPIDEQPRPTPIAIEVGYTWLIAEAQRTGINAEAKVLMFNYAFDVLGVERITLKTDARNERSRRNIERAGATFDGILRRHMPASDGGFRDSAMFSLLREEWHQLGNHRR